MVALDDGFIKRSATVLVSIIVTRNNFAPRWDQIDDDDSDFVKEDIKIGTSFYKVKAVDDDIAVSQNLPVK